MKTSKTYRATAPSPFGPITLFSDGENLIALELPNSRRPRGAKGCTKNEALPVFSVVRKQLANYFAGKLKEFDLPLKPEGTEFQQRVWRVMRRIPYGKTQSYSELAARGKNPKAVRAVAMANARNPLAIIVPCHRVIGKNGALTGYSGGGIGRKAALLRLEGVEV
ncbi:MAG: methylated-DNA--[protein]-cysteine S-methyltransferase [Alphaproteobacteria bacterium]